MTTLTVNSYPCRDSTDIGYAIMHVDPTHPSDGPYGIAAPPWSSRAVKGAAQDTDAVELRGVLAQAGQDAPAQPPSVPAGSSDDAAPRDDRQRPRLDTFA